MPSPTDLERSISAFLDYLAVERGSAANTLTSYRRDLARYAAFCQERSVTSPAGVSETLISDFVARLGRGDPGAGQPALAPASVARCLSALRGLHRFLLLDGQAETDPSAQISAPAAPQRLPKAISLTQVEALLAAPDRQMPGGLRDVALLEVLYGTGARISEAIGLDVDDLDLADRAVLLRGKGGKQRMVPVGSAAAAAVQAYLVRGRPALARAGRGTPALFLNVRGARLSRQSAWTRLRAAADRAGLEGGPSPHTLRHSFATHLLDGGADVRVVQELLGHASVTTTQIYTLVTVDKLREVYAASHPRALG